jgi:PGF-pre-PGF domain-containing protein
MLYSLIAVLLLSAVVYAPAPIPPTINSVQLQEPDNFYSNSSGNDVIHVRVSASDAGLVNASFASLNATCGPEGNVSLAYNGTSGYYEGSCNVSDIAEATANFSGGPMMIFAFPTIPGPPVMDNSTIITLVNMTTPGLGPCSQWGPSTTNFKTGVSNFGAINMILEMQMNLSCMNPGMNFSLAPNWTKEYTTLSLLNFTSVNMSTPGQAQKLSNLQTAINVSIAPPRTFMPSRIYLNSTAFAELNTTTKISMFHLPFSSQPNVTTDPDAAGISSAITWNQGVGEGNLTFTVNGFSGYNASDITPPIVAIASPLGGANVSSPFTVNATLNGTSTQISAAFFYINGAQIANYTNVSNTANCVNTTEGSELFNCVFQATPVLGANNLTVTAYDFGGMLPGLNSSTVVAFNYTFSQIINQSVSPASPATYAPNQFYEFSAAINQTNLSSVKFEYGGQNYTNATNPSIYNVSNVYKFNRTDLAVGTYPFIWWANDTSGIWYALGSQLVVSQNSTWANVVWTVTPPANVTYGNMVEVNASGCIAPLTCNLYAERCGGMVDVLLNSTVGGNMSATVNSSNAALFGLGCDNYFEFFSGGNANYSLARIYYPASAPGLRVLPRPVALTLTTIPSGSAVWGTNTTFNCSANESLPAGSIQLLVNGVDKTGEIGLNLSRAVGPYTINCSVVNPNYTATPVSTTYTVNKSAGNISLLINGNAADTTVIYGNPINVSASTLYGALTLLRNGSDVTGTNNQQILLSVGVYNYTALSAGDENHSVVNLSRTLTVIKAATAMNLTINGASANATLKYGTSAIINATLSPAIDYFQIYDNGVMIQNGTSSTSPLSITTTLTPGMHTISANFSGNSNYNSSNMTLVVNQTAVYITLSSPTNRIYNVTSVDVNFTVSTATNSPLSTLWYTLSNGTTVSKGAIFNNFTVAGFVNGTYTLMLYANDSIESVQSAGATFVINIGGNTSSTEVANSSNFSVDPNITTVVPALELPDANITIPTTILANETITLDLTSASMTNSSTQVNVTIPNTLTLIRDTTTTDYLVTFQGNTTITGNASWNGTLIMPLVKSASLYSVSSGAVDAVVLVGSDLELNFTQPVKVVITGQAGHKAAWSSGGTTLTDIPTVCNSVTAPTNINSVSPRECYIDSGSDLVIWTYHFTIIASYHVLSQTPSGGGGGGDMGGGAMPPASTTSETQSIPTIGAGAVGVAKFTKTTIPVSEIGITAAEKMVGTTVTVSVMESNSTTITIAAAGNVYSYLDIKTNKPSSAISQAAVKFRVEKSWLTTNGLVSSQMVLSHFSEGAWTDLATDVTSEDDQYVYFSAVTSGFSLFAITAKPLEAGKDCRSEGCASGKSCKLVAGAWTCVTPSKPDFCTTVCSEGQSQKDFPDCSCYVPGAETCATQCAAGEQQNAYPDCGCVAAAVVAAAPDYTTYGVVAVVVILLVLVVLFRDAIFGRKRH